MASMPSTDNFALTQVSPKRPTTFYGGRQYGGRQIELFLVNDHGTLVL